MVVLLASAIAVIGVWVLISEVRKKYVTIWLGSYLRQQLRPRYVALPGERTHILFCLVDHFEPLAGPTKAVERQRMEAWAERYPRLAQCHTDSDGRPPQHTWFYPGEQYDEECLEGLSGLVRGGFGEIELHLHHGYDIPERLEARLRHAITQFSKHGALITDEDALKVAYAFIHGNLGLNNSRGVESCGVNNELPILRDTGCYADFSMPTAPCESQTRKINSIYYAHDKPGQPKSHDDGTDVEVGKKPEGDLMIIQGPLAINRANRRYGIIPRIENAEISCSNPPTPSRIRLWVSQHIHVKGRPDRIIVKVSCHGAEDRNREVLLGEPADQMYSYLEAEYRDRPGYRLHYVTARQLYNIIKAAESGLTGDPNLYRDYLIPQYRNHADPILHSTIRR